MALTINQKDFYRFERLVSKLIKPADNPMVCFIPTDGNFKLAAFSQDAILTMSVAKQGFMEPFAVPLLTLKPLAVNKKDTEITFAPQGKTVHIQSGEEQRWVDCEKQVNTLPTQPKATAPQSKQFLDVLHQTAKCVDTNDIRVAINGICLRGETSQILATSGVQLVVHEGFEFPFKQDVICPVSKIFGSKELLAIDTDEVRIGQINEMVYFAVGEVEIWLRAIEGKFPKVDRLLVPAKEATVLEITPADAEFIVERIDKLPGKKKHEATIWLSLDDKIQVRAYDLSQKSGTALELSHSTFTGTHTTVSMNRTFLKNAMQFGCLHLYVDPENRTPVVCIGKEKSFVFMPLSTKEPEVDATKMNVIASASAMKEVSVAKQATPATAPAPVKKRRRRRTTSVKPGAVTPVGTGTSMESALQLSFSIDLILVFSFVITSV